MPAENAKYINVFANEGVEATTWALNAGITLLLEIAENDANKRQALLAISVKRDLDGMIAPVLGQPFTSQLKNHSQTDFTDPEFQGVVIDLRLMTIRNQIPFWNCPILAIHPRMALLDRIHALHGVTDLIVVPLNPHDVEDWIDAQEPEAINRPPADAAIGDPSQAADAENV